MPFNVDALKPSLQGPNLEAFFSAVENAYTDLDALHDLARHLSSVDPVWDPTRADYDLALMTRQRAAIRTAGSTDSRHYRALRLLDVGHWSHGTYADLVRLAAAWIGSVAADPTLTRVYAWPLSVALLFAPSVAPTVTDYADLRSAVLRSVSDVASFAVLVGPPGAALDDLLILDLTPGLDKGVLADLLQL